MNFQSLLRLVANSRFLRFAFIGTCGFVVDEAVLATTHYAFALNSYGAGALSTFCAATFTWWGNRNLTFREHAASGGARSIAIEWLRFMAANSVGALANYGTFTLLVSIASWPMGNPLLAKAIGALVGLAFNFTLSKRFVFREPPVA